jgi:hypothetical protein
MTPDHIAGQQGMYGMLEVGYHEDYRWQPSHGEGRAQTRGRSHSWSGDLSRAPMCKPVCTQFMAIDMRASEQLTRAMGYEVQRSIVQQRIARTCITATWIGPFGASPYHTRVV